MDMILDLEQPAIALTALPPMQAGPVYHCFECGGPVKSLKTWNEMPRISAGHAELDEWGEHIAYLVGTGCGCNHRVAKLDDCITPLVFPRRAAFATHTEFVAAEVDALRAALAVIALWPCGTSTGCHRVAASVPEDERTHDAPTKVVMQLLAGLLVPAAAIAQIRALAGGTA